MLQLLENLRNLLSDMILFHKIRTKKMYGILDCIYPKPCWHEKSRVSYISSWAFVSSSFRLFSCKHMSLEVPHDAEIIEQKIKSIPTAKVTLMNINKVLDKESIYT